jgi:hypothetical protein
MKQFRLTLVLLIVCAALGAYVWFFERGEVAHPTAWKLDAASIRRIELTSEGTTTVVERRGKSWRITRPVSAGAARDRMKDLLDGVAKIEMRRRIQEARQLKDYGLARPAASIKVVLANGESRELRLGDKTPDNSAVYAAQKGSATVFLADIALLNDAAGGAAVLRDRSALPFDRRTVERIVLRRPGAQVALEKRGKQWEMVAPVAAASDEAAVDGLLASLEGVEASRFAAESAQDLSRYGLSSPRLVLEVASAGGRRARRLAVGAEAGAGEYYAKNSVEPAIMVVPKSAFDSINKSAADLRAKQIAAIAVEQVRRIAIARGDQRFELEREGEKRWMLTSPRRMEADAQTLEDLLWELSDMRAQAFIDHPGPLAGYGLDPPQAAVTIHQNRLRQPLRIWFGGPAASNRIYVKTEAATIYEVPAAVLARIPRSADALRNLTLLSYEPGEIKRLRAVYGGKTVALEREDSKWRLTQPQKRPANAERVEALLAIVERVRAERYLTESPVAGLTPHVGPNRDTLRLMAEATGRKPQTLGAWVFQSQTQLQLQGNSSLYEARPGFLRELTDALNAIVAEK